MKNNPFLAVFLATISALAFAAAGQPIQVNCAGPVQNLSQSWVRGYAAKHPEFKIEVAAGSAPAAFSALAGKKSQLAIALRSMRYPEAKECEAAFGQRAQEFKLAVNGVAIYVHASNPVKDLTYKEIEAVFQGKVRDWRRLGVNAGTIVALGMSTDTPAGDLFGEEVLGGKALAPEVRIVDAAELMATLATETNAIAFGPLAQAKDVRAIEIRRAESSTPVSPTDETISNRIYPISRFVFGYADPTANPAGLKEYLDWIRSDEGQQIARKAGFFQLSAKWRGGNESRP
jgi:phosphate transport system substrate-binding protein